MSPYRRVKYTYSLDYLFMGFCVKLRSSNQFHQPFEIDDTTKNYFYYRTLHSYSLSVYSTLVHLDLVSPGHESHVKPRKPHRSKVRICLHKLSESVYKIGAEYSTKYCLNSYHLFNGSCLGILLIFVDEMFKMKSLINLLF